MLLLSFFVIINAQIATIPYFCNFTDAAENARWTIPNSITANKWAIDLENSGSLVCKANTSGTSVAFREFNTIEGERYLVIFNWQLQGESDFDSGGSFDGLRVFWVDDSSVNVSAWATSEYAPVVEYQKYYSARKTSLPQQSSFIVTGNGHSAKLVFVWTNDASSQDISGSIDNITIQYMPTTTTASSININQTTPYNTYTPDQLVKDVFVSGGQCLVSNVTFQGLGWNGSSWASASPRSLAYFDNGTTDTNGIGIVSGLLLATGNALDAVGPNTSPSAMPGGVSGTDPDLQALIPGYSVQTVTKLEFDMIPYTSTLSFDYVFASEEYPEFSCSTFNDVFGFFISGPGIVGNQNVALLPYSTTPVAICNVHPAYGSSCPAVNAQYYVDGTSNQYTEFDGWTKMLPTAPITVIPGQTYHLKLAVANVGDSNYGSGVFLRAGSLDLGSYVINQGADVEGMDNVFAGCNQNAFSISLFPFPTEVNISLSYSGVDVNDVVSPDGSPLPTSITVPPSTTEISVPYKINSPVTVNGGDFNINVNVEYCSDATGVTKTIYVFDRITNPQIDVVSSCDSPTGVLSVNTNEGSPALKLSYDNGYSWFYANNFSGSVPVGEHQILFKDSISCNVDTFDINIPYITSSQSIVYDTISMGETYTVPPFHLPEQDHLGDFDFSVTLPNANMYGCDSTVNLYLTVNEILVDFFPLDEICADNSSFDINFDVVAGRVTTYSVLFNDKAHAAGFEDIINQEIIAQRISIFIPASVRPDHYSAIVRLSSGDSQNMQKDFQYEFTIDYPSGIIVQRWNDVLALLNQYFNGGYLWASYQWYKNDEQIPNETGSYLYVGANGGVLDTTANYRVLLTRNDGVSLFTCKFTPVIVDPNSYLTVRPTLASPYQPITIIFADGKSATLWNILGVQVSQYQLTNGVNTIPAPNQAGTYILKVENTQGEMRTAKITVQ